MKAIQAKNPHLYYIVLLNLGMLFISTSGVLGRYIALPPSVSIWVRSLIALILLVLYARFKKFNFQINWKNHGAAICCSGILMAIHWITYFFALQWSNVAIGMLSLFTYPIITVFLEPFFIPVKLQKMHLLLGGLILLGIYFLVPAFDLKNSGTQGLLIGLFSALAYALRNLILKKYNAMGNGSVQMIYQLVVVVVLLAPVLWLYPEADIVSQWPYLFILGAITTALGHTLFLSSFSHFNISTASIMSSIQPLFGVLLGALFLYEIPTLKSVFGGALILTTVLIESKRSRTKK